MRSERVRVVKPTPSVPRLGHPLSTDLSVDAVFRDQLNYVAAIGLRLLGSEDETDDLIQDVFVVAAEGLHRLRDTGALRGWLASITVRLALRRLRRRRRLRVRRLRTEP